MVDKSPKVSDYLAYSNPTQIGRKKGWFGSKKVHHHHHHPVQFLDSLSHSHACNIHSQIHAPKADEFEVAAQEDWRAVTLQRHPALGFGLTIRPGPKNKGSDLKFTQL